MNKPNTPFSGKRCPDCGAVGYKRIKRRAGTLEWFDVVCRRGHPYAIQLTKAELES